MDEADRPLATLVSIFERFVVDGLGERGILLSSRISTVSMRIARFNLDQRAVFGLRTEGGGQGNVD